MNLLPCKSVIGEALCVGPRLKKKSIYSFLHTQMSVPINLDLECC